MGPELTRVLSCGSSCLVVLLSAASATAEEPSHFFEMRVQPVLSRNCMGCHGSSAVGGLRLDSREYAMKGGKDGAVIVPGDPDGSLLIRAVRRTHERLKMRLSGFRTRGAPAGSVF